MKLKLYILFLLLYPKLQFADSNVVISYYDQDMMECSQNEYKYVSKTTYRNLPHDSSAISEFHNRKGQLVYKISYWHYPKEILHGEFFKFYKNGRVQTHLNYHFGLLNGLRTTYYKNGKLKRKDSLHMDLLIHGQLYSKSGKSIPYIEYNVDAKYPGGLEKFKSDLFDNYKYPKSMIRRNKQGVTLLYCYISTRGKVKNINIRRSSGSDALDAAAIKALKKCSKWEPALQDGEKTKYYLAVPVVAKIIK